MKNELTPLEAFRYLIENKRRHWLDNDNSSECLDVIEKELKESEKNKQALEIIKNKGVFVHLLQQSKNVEEYNSLMLIAFKKMAERDYKGAVEKFCLTQEEFNLLKEVML